MDILSACMKKSLIIKTGFYFHGEGVERESELRYGASAING
jgi:hypothetical protein